MYLKVRSYGTEYALEFEGNKQRIYMKTKIILSLLTIFIVSSCKLTLTGKLEAYEPLTFTPKKKKYDVIQVDKGEYTAKLTFKSKKKLYLTFKDDKKKKVLFRIPKSKKLPKTSGSFVLLASESGQPYDLEGTINTTYSQGEQYTTSQSCSETFYRRVCHRNDEGERECERQSYTEYGSQDVTGHAEYTQKALSSILKDAVSQIVIGQFHGSSFTTDYTTDYTGPCRLGLSY